MADEPSEPAGNDTAEENPASAKLRSALLADVEHGRDLREQSSSLLQRLLLVLQSFR